MFGGACRRVCLVWRRVTGHGPWAGVLCAPSGRTLAHRPGSEDENAPHAGVGLHTAASVHYGTAGEIRAQRALTLGATYAANPARFPHRRPLPPKLPTMAWINQATPEALIESA